MREEKDSMGKILVPDDVYYGAQTQRAVENFQISDRRIPKTLIRSLGIIKKSAAITNYKLKKINFKTKNAIVKSCNEIISGKHDNQFVVDIFQTGSGTSTNMNTNEVISNRANEILGHKIGQKFPVHPNDHVNLGQSSNDTFPTSINIAICLDLKEKLYPELNALSKSLRKKFQNLKILLKLEEHIFKMQLQ